MKAKGRPLPRALTHLPSVVPLKGLLRLVATLAVLAPAASAQVESRLHRPECAACRVELQEIRTVGSRDDPVLISRFSELLIDSRGRHFAAGHDLYQVIVFDANGRYLTAIGRRGQGPGEIAAPGIAHLSVGPGDTLFVMHGVVFVSVYTPELKFVRTTRVPYGTVTRFAAVDAGFLIAGVFRDSAHFGRPYHFLDKSGAIVRSFGDQKVATVAYTSETAQRMDLPPDPFVLSGDRKSIWAVAGYRVRQWSISGTLLSAFDLTGSPWFPAVTFVDARGRSGQPVRMASGGGFVYPLGFDSEGRLWTAATRTDSRADPPRQQRAFEVIDPSRRELVTSHEVSSGASMPRPGIVVTRREDADGVLTFHVFQARVIRP